MNCKLSKFVQKLIQNDGKDFPQKQNRPITKNLRVMAVLIHRMQEDENLKPQRNNT